MSDEEILRQRRSASVKQELLDELAASPINSLRVRVLCRENPGLIAKDSRNTRLSVWSLLLTGQEIGINNDGENDDEDVFVDPRQCMEHHVLEADVKRTRAEIEDFRSNLWRSGVHDVLNRFCVQHNLQYKQGMNEIAAPFLFLNPPSNKRGLHSSYLMFEAFLFRYAERYFCQDDSSFLFKSFRLFHLLLVYHDPQVGLHLSDCSFPPELYASPWLLTLYSRQLPMSHVLRLWDMLIAIDDPGFNFFIGLCLLLRKRSEILLADAEEIPEVFTSIALCGEEDVDSIVIEAQKLYSITPRCFLRCLRLCCVSTTDLTPLPRSRLSIASPSPPSQSTSASSVSSSYNSTSTSTTTTSISSTIPSIDSTQEPTNHDVIMAMQAARQSLMITAQEFVDLLMIRGEAASTTTSASSPVSTSSLPLPSTSSSNLNEISKDNSQCTNNNGTSNSPRHLVVIDIRSSEEIEISGAGVLPCAVQLEPEFLDQPDGFDIWLQHFDAMRGCTICIVDLPPVHGGFISLWRRLILGEGDGKYSSTLYDAVGTGVGTNADDQQSIYRDAEAKAKSDDKIRPAVRLASALQRHCFPYVCVLEGGLPSLIEYLTQSRGYVEPLLINHDAQTWESFCNSTGRTIGRGNNNSNDSALEKKRKKSPSHNGSGKMNQRTKRVGDLTPLEVYKLALTAAMRLGHVHMQSELMKKIAHLEGRSVGLDEGVEESRGVE